MPRKFKKSKVSICLEHFAATLTLCHIISPFTFPLWLARKTYRNTGNDRYQCRAV